MKRSAGAWRYDGRVLTITVTTRALLAGSALLLVTSSSVASERFHDVRAAAQAAARTDVGRAYVLQSIPFTRKFHDATRRSCGRMPSHRPVQLVLIVASDGAIERIEANGRTRKTRCYVDYILGRSLPPPPTAPYPLALTFK